MAVFRIERTRDYTVMSNHHLRNANLSLKAKGLLSMMLSLPEDWNYTTRGLAAICKEGVDAIGGAAGAGNCWVHCPPSAARPAGSDQRYRVCYLRATTAEEPGYAPAGYGFTRYGKPGYGKTGYGKARRIKYREIKYRKNNYLWIKYRFYSLPGGSGSTAAGTERKGCDVCLRDGKLSGFDSGEHRV